MSSFVLYRKYRPQKFAEVVGQSHVTGTLLNAISSGKIAHAYLFSGPRGCGKTTVARLLAKAANCEKTDSPEPCNKCESCLDIIANRSMDIIEIDAASHRGIDEVRELREGVRFGPAKSKYKIFILDEAHQLTSGAANALLKILEDAPAHAIFILATTEPQKMIATIISRCQRFDFRKINIPEMVTRLEKVAKKEEVAIEKEVFPMIASASGGSLRDAESLLSQIISFVPEKGVVRREDIKNLLGVIEREVVGDFVESLLKDEAVEALRIMESSLNQGISSEAFHENIMYYLREMMILKILSGKENEKGADSLMNSILTRLTEEEVGRIKTQVEGIDINDVKMLIASFHEAGERIKFSPIPHLPLEVAVAETSEGLRKKGN